MQRRLRTWKQASKTRYPPPDGNFNQLVTDGAGNVGWAPRLAYQKETFSWDYDANSEYEEVQTESFGTLVLADKKVWTNDMLRSIVLTAPNGQVLAAANMWDYMVEEGYVTDDWVFCEGFMAIRKPNTYVGVFNTTFSSVGLYIFKGIISHVEAVLSKKKTIDPKFLPANIKPLIVTIEMDDSDNKVASATYEEIASAITSGQTVMCVYGTQAFKLVDSPVLSDIAPMLEALPAHSFFHVTNYGTYANFEWIDINSNNEVIFIAKELTYAT